MPARRLHIDATSCKTCNFRGLQCHKITEEEREIINCAYYDMGNLQRQREWISKHISPRQSSIKSESQKNQCVDYFLPNTSSPGSMKWKVCRKMFITTLNISDRQIRTVLLQKSDACGVLQIEKRGGRQQWDKDRLCYEEVKGHIDMFPRMESHFCQANSKCQYLSPDLNQQIMYRMYKNDHPNGVSLSFYKKVFHSLNLKFHHPKKDACGLCEEYSSANEAKKEELHQVYHRHITEKEAVREIKEAAKKAALTSKKYSAHVFDLQQVIYLPQSNRSEIFYKRRLACFNFTIFNLGSREGFCFLSHEGETGRGSCEIASHLHHYLQIQDERGIEVVELYHSSYDHGFCSPIQVCPYCHHSLL